MQLFSKKLIILYVVIGFIVLGLVSSVMEYWYGVILDLHKQRLAEIVHRGKNTISAAYENRQHSGTMSQHEAMRGAILFIQESFKNSQPFGYESRFLIAKQENSRYTALFRSINGQPFALREPLPDQPENSAVVLASRGLSGIKRQLDDNGRDIVVAYDYLDLGDNRLLILGCVPYSEITRSRLVAVISGAVICLVIFIGGGGLFFFYNRGSFNALQKAHKELETFGYVMNSANELISYIGKDGRYIAVNDAYEKTFGVPRENISGMHLMEFHGIKRYNEYLRGAVEKCLHGVEVKLQHWYDFMGGYRKFFEMTFVPHYVDGEVAGIVMTANDITELENAKLELLEKTRDLKKMTIELEEKVRQETEKRLHNEQAFFEQKKFADMGQMMNAIAHQWRQPINALGLYIQYILDSAEEGNATPEMLEGFRQDSMNLVQHLSKTIDDFRSFFEPAKKREVFQVVKAIAETLSLVEAQLESDYIECRINCRCGDDSCDNVTRIPECHNFMTFVEGFSSEFKQVLMNIIQNAKDAMETRAAGKLLVISIFNNDEEVVVSICDNGGGIDRKIMGNIFDPYFTTKKEGKGTGVGLYMSRLIVEDHMGGKLSAHNTDSGACFEMKLRAVRKPESE